MDEQNNITWARTLEQAGVHVVYGIVGLKTHCKAALVVRREADGIRRYVHLSTGNYNPTTARSYTDLGLFTAEPDVGEDFSALFNLLTGYADGYEWRKLLVAPRTARADHRTDRARAAERAAAPAGAHHREDERAGGAIRDRRVVPGVPGGRPDRPRHPRHLLLAPRAPRRLRNHPGDQHRRPVPRAQPHLLLRERPPSAAAARQPGLDGP